MGCDALSVEIPITVLTPLSIATLATFDEPKIFTSEHSKGNSSEISTNFVFQYLAEIENNLSCSG